MTSWSAAEDGKLRLLMRSAIDAIAADAPTLAARTPAGAWEELASRMGGGKSPQACFERWVQLSARAIKVSGRERVQDGVAWERL